MKHIYKKGRLDERETRKYMRQIVSAVDHLHKAGIIHRCVCVCVCVCVWVCVCVLGGVHACMYVCVHMCVTVFLANYIPMCESATQNYCIMHNL